MEINADIANCATGRDLRRLGRRANLRRMQMGDSQNEIEISPNSRDEEKGGVGGGGGVKL